MSRGNDETGKGTTWLVRAAAFIVDKRVPSYIVFTDRTLREMSSRRQQVQNEAQIGLYAL